MISRRELCAHFTTYHQSDDVVLSNVCYHLRFTDVLTVSKNGNAVADRLAFVELMGDEQNCDALALELEHQLQQIIDLAARQRRSRLVHDDQLCLTVDCTGDLYQLSLAHAVLGHRGIQLDIGQTDVVESGTRTLSFLCPVDEHTLLDLVAQIHVLDNAQDRDITQLLVNDGNTLLIRIGNRLVFDLLALPPNFAAFRLVDTDDGLNHCRLTCAIFAEQQVDLTALDRQINVAECYNAWEHLGNVFHFQQDIAFVFRHPFILLLMGILEI